MLYIHTYILDVLNASLITSGISITNTVPLTTIDHDEIKAVLSEYRISNADVAIREPNCTADDVVDVIEGNR